MIVDASYRDIILTLDIRDENGNKLRVESLDSLRLEFFTEEDGNSINTVYWGKEPEDHCIMISKNYDRIYLWKGLLSTYLHSGVLKYRYSIGTSPDKVDFGDIHKTMWQDSYVHYSNVVVTDYYLKNPYDDEVEKANWTIWIEMESDPEPDPEPDPDPMP